MTSKNCFSKMIVRDLKERGVWLISSIILFLLIYPVQILMSLDAIASYMKGEEEFYSKITEQFSSLMSFGNEIMYVVIVIMAFLLAMSGFWYVYSGVKTDFYHSLPIKREKLFLERYVTGILIFIVPYFISLMLGYGAGIMKEAGTSGILSLCAKGFITNVVLFLLLYNLAVLGVLLTGNLFTGVLAYGAFLSYGILLESTISLTKYTFFTTYIENSRLSQTFEGKLGKFSPLYVFDMILSNNNISMKDVSVVFGISVLFLVICISVYKIRPTEAYHKSIAFKKLQPIIKVVVVLPISACVGILSSEIVGRNFIWYVGGLLVTAVLLSFAMEFLYYLDIRECIRPKISTGLILGMLVIMAVALKLDLIGFDTYLPKESRVKNMSIYINGLNGCYDYPEGAGEMYGTTSFLQNTRIEEFDAIYQLAKKAVAIQKEDKRTADSEITAASEITDSEELYFSVRYEMKNGKEVYRGYCIPKDEENLKLIADIYDNWEFKRQVLPVEYVKEEKISSLDIADLQSSHTSELSKETIKSLFKTCKNEWESATYEQLSNDKVLGFLRFYLDYDRENGDYDTGSRCVSVPVYSSFQQTRKLLEQNGCKMMTFEDYDKVERIEISQRDDKTGDLGAILNVTDENQIREIFEALYITDNSEIFNISTINYQIEVQIDWKSEVFTNTDGFCSCYFRTDEVPEFVTKELEE